MKAITSLTAALLMTTGMAWAASVSPETVIADYTAQGFTRVEVKSGPTQIKVEAIRGTEKVEVVYDIASGTVLSREVETVDSGDDTRPGVEIRNRDEDFVGGSRSDDDNDDDDRDDDRSDDDSGDSPDDSDGRGDDRDDDGRDDDGSDDNGSDDSDDRGDDHGGDDDGDDDHGGHGSDDSDDGDDDHGGRGSDDRDDD